MSVTHELAKYIAKARYEDFPQEVIDKARLLILDTLGCALGGFSTVLGEIVVDAIKELGGNPHATIVGDGGKVNCVEASYVNAILADALDFEDTVGHLGHPAATIIPPALAVGEYVKASGRDMITAVVLGYEVSIRIGVAKRPSWLGVYPPVGAKKVATIYTWQSFGAGTAAGKLLGLDEDKMASAFGYTGSSTPLPTKWGEKGGSLHWVKPNFGEDTASGVLGAILAKRGFLGCDTILDGDDGFWIMSGSDRCDFDQMTWKLGEEYEIIKVVGFKPYPCCRGTHATLDAVKAILEEQKINETDIEEITAKTRSANLYNEYRPCHIVDAEFSIPYAVAMLIRGEELGPEWYTERNLRNPHVLNLASKVRVVGEPEADRLHIFPLRKWVSTVTIRTKDGKSFTKHVDCPKGEPENPMTEDEIINKFRVLASYVKLKQEEIDKIIAMVMNLEELDDVSKLAAMLTP
jgi:2-methylcitrate dehydratase PrpD